MGKILRITASTNQVSSKVSKDFELDAGTESDKKAVEEIARDMLWELINWDYEIVDSEDAGEDSDDA